jgi:hypothetical protein
VNCPAAFAGIEGECYAGNAVCFEGVEYLDFDESSVECSDPHACVSY